MPAYIVDPGGRASSYSIRSMYADSVRSRPIVPVQPTLKLPEDHRSSSFCLTWCARCRPCMPGLSVKCVCVKVRNSRNRVHGQGKPRRRKRDNFPHNQAVDIRNGRLRVEEHGKPSISRVHSFTYMHTYIKYLHTSTS